MKQLGGMDASFLYMETPQTPMHVAGLSIVELPRGLKGHFYEVYKRAGGEGGGGFCAIGADPAYGAGFLFGVAALARWIRRRRR